MKRMTKESIKKIIACVMALGLCLGLCACAIFEKKPEPQPADLGISTKPEGTEIEEPEKNDEPDFSVDDIIRFANDSKYMMEFAQRFYNDYIIYTDDSGKFTYVPVNDDLPKSDYNWDNLVRVSGKTDLAYVENGELKSKKGIDVSQYQEHIDWEKVGQTDVEFAMIRLGLRGYGSEGRMRLDTEFENNIIGALKNGIDVGVYFITQATSVEEARAEAEFILEAIAPYKIKYPVVLDVEAAASADARTALLTAEQRTDYIIEFCETIKDAGYTPMIYTNIRWFIDKMQLERLTEYDKWFAQYFNRPFFPYEFQMWQYTNQGSVSGIKGNVDINLCFVNYAD